MLAILNSIIRFLIIGSSLFFFLSIDEVIEPINFIPCPSNHLQVVASQTVGIAVFL